jgi:CelD/BcsL family acetyltransferase involved in cellulose biosynthesis
LLKCRVVSKIEDLEPLRGRWEELRVKCGGSVFSSFDWTLLWIKSFGHVASPRVLTVKEAGDLRGIAPFVMSERTVMGIKVRRLSFVGTEAGAAEYYDLGILCDDGEAIDAIFTAMRGMNWNVLNLVDLKETEQSKTLCKRIAEEWYSEDLTRIPCPFVELPETGDVIATIQARMRRTIRKTVSELGGEGRISFKTRESAEDVRNAMRTYIQQHMTRWKNKGGSIFEDRHLSEFIVEIAGNEAERGNATVCETLIDDVVASQMFCLVEGDCVRAYRIGINDKYLDYTPGNLVAYFAMQEAQRKGSRIFDFGKGAEEFKYRMGAKDRFLIGIHARRGSVRMMSQLASVPGVRGIAEKTGAKESALRKVYQ